MSWDQCYPVAAAFSWSHLTSVLYWCAKQLYYLWLFAGRTEKMQLDLFSPTKCAHCICYSYKIYHQIICTACFNHTHPQGHDIMHLKKNSNQKILHTSTEILCLTYMEGTKRLLAIGKLVKLLAKLSYTGRCLFQALCRAKKSLIPPVYLSNHILVWSNNVKAEHSRWCLDQ